MKRMQRKELNRKFRRIKSQKEGRKMIKIRNKKKLKENKRFRMMRMLLNRNR